MVAEKLKELRLKISSICQKIGRAEKEIELVLVTKQVGSEAIREAYALGVKDFGENRVREWLQKKGELPQDIRWHLIGHLQTNKVKDCIAGVNLIHSLDSIHLAHAIETNAGKQGITVNCLIQVNVSGEATKHGIKEEEVEPFVREALKLPHICLNGFMTIGPLTEDKLLVRSSFQKLREVRDQMRKKIPQVDWKYLSMGMSSDFQIALEEGANLLRIGTAVFGERPIQHNRGQV
ncbi:MAG: YggS family pyridoxal phosphate-dependent enzyme [Candidatus Omnitrophica bacterium]|nr:YggS family pyridoxal phosphate-dependent enzyme [Candidatus Omnitrophota bacterium]